jgi:DNA-binding beta-propeller fold protein YncE
VATPSPVRQPIMARRRSLWLVSGLGLLVLLAAAAVLAWLWGGSSPPSAQALALHGPLLFLLQTNSVEIVDAAGGTVAGRLALPARPAWAAVSPDRGLFLITSGQGLLAYSTDGYRLMQREELGGWPRRVAFRPDGSAVAVTLAEVPDVLVYARDGAALRPLRRLPTGGEPGALLFDPSRQELVVGLEDAVIGLAMESGSETFRVTIPKPHQKDPVRKLALGPRGDLYALYINEEHLGAIALIRPDRSVTVHEFGRVLHDFVLSPDGQNIYVTWRTPVGERPRRGGVLALDAQTFEPVRPEIPLGWAFGLALSPDGTSLYVTEGRRPFRWAIDLPGYLLQIDLAGWQVASRRQVGRLPVAVTANY